MVLRHEMIQAHNLDERERERERERSASGNRGVRRKKHIGTGE